MICAIDCDLRTSYGVRDDGETHRSPAPWPCVAALCAGRKTGTVLFEISSPVSFNRGAAGHAAMTQLAKWAIWNAAQAGQIHSILGTCAAYQFLVAPSNVWTKGFDLKTRHAMAKCKQPKKDLRECEAMIWFYQKDPGSWKSLPDYLATL